MTVRKYSSISQDTTLATTINSVATSLTVAAGTGASLLGGITLSAGDIFTIAIDVDTINEEIMYVTARTGDVLTVTRAQAGSSAVTHSAGATIQHVLSSSDLNWFNNMIQSNSAIGTTPTLDGNSNQVQMRRDTAAALTAANPTLAAGEIAFETDTGKFKIGTGSAVWTSLGYASILPSLITAKGDLLAGQSSGVAARLAVGANNTVLTADSTQTLGVKWATVAVPTLDLTFNAQTGTTYTLVSGDVNKLVTCSNASAITVTIPNGVFTTGQQINIQQIGAGQVTIASDGTTVITSTGATATAPKLRAQYSAATIICTSSNNFTVIGDLS